MSTVHFIVQGKGGVGKSFVSILLAQYLSRDRKLYCADTDPNNATFASFKAFGAQHINIAPDRMNVDKKRFDILIEQLTEHDGDSVVDSGASNFLALMTYLEECKVFPLLKNCGKRTIVHVPLVGGQGMDETIRGLMAILTFPDIEVVVWENEFMGAVIKNGKKFAQTELYAGAAERILGIVNIQSRCSHTFKVDIEAMTTKRLSFDEVMVSKDFRLMERQRLAEVRRDIDVQLDVLEI